MASRSGSWPTSIGIGIGCSLYLASVVPTDWFRAFRASRMPSQADSAQADSKLIGSRQVRVRPLDPREHTTL